MTDRHTVIVTIQHPAHVHFFRNPIQELLKKGHDVHVFARAKDIATDLLEAYELPYTRLAGEIDSTFDAIREQSKYEFNLLRHARRLDPDVLMAIGEPGITHVGAILDAKSVVFTDTENRMNIWLQKVASIPFADAICTPSAFTTDLGPKQLSYDGYHELAYLHPDRFTPDRSILESHSVDPSEEYYVLRAIAWNAYHDYGLSGFSRDGLQEIVSLLSERGTVYITSEIPLPAALEPYRLSIPVERIHDLLYYADGYIGDSGTMATEAALLGTMAIRTDPIAAEQESGNFLELEKHGLLFSTPDEDEAIEKLRASLDDTTVTNGLDERLNSLLEKKIDVTSFVVDLVESLPEAGNGRQTGSALSDLRINTNRTP